MKRKITFLIAAMMLLTMNNLPMKVVGQTYTKLTSVVSIDEDAVYVLGITYSSTDYYHYSGTSSWGKVATTASQTPYYYTLTAGSENTFQAKTKIGNTDYYLTVPSSNFSLSTNSTNIYLNNNAQIVNASSSATKALQYNHSNGSGGIRSYGFNSNYPYAFFYKVNCTVTYNCNGGTSGCPDSPVNNVSGSYTLANAPTKTGWTFDGWSDGTNTYDAGDTYIVKSNVTFTAQWSSTTPTITLNPTEAESFTYAHGTGASESQIFEITLTNSTEDITVSVSSTPAGAFEISEDDENFGTSDLTLSSGDVFSTHLKSGLNIGEYSGTVTISSEGADDVTIDLDGTVTGYTVTYNGNGSDGGTTPTDATVYTYNQSVTAKNNTFVKTGYDFTHWDTKADDSGTDIDEGASFNITSSTTLYAQWSLSSYAYTLTKTGETSHATAQLKNGNTVIGASDEIPYNTEVTIDVTTDSGYSYTVSVKDAGDNDVTVTNNKFNMPASAVAVTINIMVNPYLLATLTGDNMTNMSNAGTTYEISKSITIDGLTWTTTGFQNAKPIYQMIQLKNDADVYLKLPNFDGKIKEIALTVTNANATSFSEGSNQTSNTLTFNTSASYSNPVATGGGSNTNHITIDLSDKFYTTGYILANGATRIWEVTVTYMPYDNFTDWNPETQLPASLSAGANIAIASDMSTASLTIPATAALVVKSDATLTATSLTNSGSAANLVIEDGGQLITSSSVQLTYKKGITSAAKDGGWYTISTPVHTASNTFLEHESVENMILTPATNYDLFYYNETTHYWMNYKQAEFDLNVGQGYLYRNNGAELHFAGYNNQATSYNVALSYASTEDKLLGFNLIGNPYPQNITMSDVTVNNGGTLSGGYVLSKDGAWSADVAATIAPAQGFLVQIDKTGVTATITKPTGGSKSRANNDYIKFVVANSQHEDAAFALFEEGYGLNKIDHRNSDIPMLYIPKEGHNFAIATMAYNTQSFNLNLKAKTTGKYTLSYKATGNYSYLHVIDRLTGEDVDMLLDGEYSFIASPSDAENRFIVRLEYSNGYENSEDSIFAYQSGSDIIVNGEGELQIFDVMGRRILTQYVSGVETINLQSHGVYIFKLNEKTQKIVVR